MREGRVVGLANHTILLAKDGSEVPIDDSAAPIRCKAGEIVGCVLVFRDISSRKREEAASFERNRLVALRADVGTALSSVENTRTVLQNCCEAFVRHLDLAFARIWTLDEGDDVLRLEASAGDYKHLDGTHSRIKVGEFKIGRIAESRQPHLTNNVADDPNIGDPEWAAKENMVAFAGYPLIVEDRLVGVIAMFARRELTASIVEELNPVVHGISQYIDRKHAEGKLDDHAELYRVTLSSIGDGVITTDTDGSVTFMNEVASDLTGWTATAGFGQPLEKVFRIVDETTRETVENPASKVLREGGPKELTKNIVLIAKDGVERPIDESAAPILDDAGNVIGVVLVFHDTGRRRDAARHLQESEVRFGQLADSMPQIVWASKPDGTFDYYNRRWFQYINLNPSQIEEARWDLYIHPDDLSSAYKRWQESLASGKRYKTEFRVRDAKGEYRWFLAQALPVTDDDGKITRWFGTCTDVDEEKQTANELRNVAARLSEADRRKDEFIAMLAHELRNPLAPIRNALQILRITGGSDNKLRSASEMMERQVGQLVRLVDDLLDVSRISRGKIELRRERIELDSVVYHALEAARPSCENGGVEFNIRMPEEPIFVYGDAARLAQAFGNVLNNACKFTDRDGRIDLSVDPEDEQAVVRILDTGIGISPQQLPRIFDMFVQADTSLERSASGLGIGLTLVKNLIEMHEGTVEAFSNGLGSGSQFTLRIPRLKEQVMPASTLDAAIHPTLDGPGRRILVVDDNIDSAESLSMLLEISGHTVQMAHDGVEAVEKAANFLPEVVLLDIGLPRLNGYEAARKIRQEIWGKRMVLIALTGWGQEEDRQRSRDAGFDDHMVKPVDHIELMKSLDEIEVR